MNYFHKNVVSLAEFIFPGTIDKYQGRYDKAWKLIPPPVEQQV